VRVTEDHAARRAARGAGGGGWQHAAAAEVNSSAPIRGGSLTSVTVMVTVAGSELVARHW
jgi:hypothetical protein